MKDLTKVNLTLDSFAQNVIDALYKQCDKMVASNIEYLLQNNAELEFLYERGKTVAQATEFFIEDYNVVYGISDR